MSAGIACARMLADLALERGAAHWQSSAEANRPTCPDCGRALIRRAHQPRQLKTHGGQDLTLTRSYGYCPNCQKGLFPLDNELALLPGRLTPLLQDQLAHLGAWMPFAKAAALLTSFTHTRVSESTAQRHTEAIGMAYQAVQLAEVEHIEPEWPEVEAGADKLVLSVDGAFVPVLHGEWAEVKTLVVGEVGEATLVDGQRVVPIHSHSYFSRVAEAEQFQRLTFGELYRRHLETAAQVASVRDEAAWIQGCIEFHAPSATRSLDFPHAAQRMCQCGAAGRGADHAS